LYIPIKFKVMIKEHTLLVERYRPSTLENYVGNEQIKSVIQNYLDQNDIQNFIFAGTAGTGKTMLAVLAALKAFRAGECSKIVITRPAVGVDDEQHGFLPGTLNQKMEPWTRPIFDIIEEYYKPQEVLRLLEEKYIEIAPLAYMRGRTFKNSWIIADEMQNATPSQMKMLLTRLGENSKMVVTGDITQVDLPNSAHSGLRVVRNILNDIDDIAFLELTAEDVVRHRLIGDIVTAYATFDETKQVPRPIRNS
jgi:phosphate starvation-inducible PhoH-like protein